MVRRACVALIAGLSLTAGAGCHLGPQPRLNRVEPPVVRTDPAAARFIAQHNRNAAAITSLRAEPSVQVVGRLSAHADGYLALERDRNFNLELRNKFKGQVANIGSNTEEFWFWVDEDKDKGLYYCDYRDVGRSALTLTYQPDWIMEAMGLRPITPEEARTVAVTSGPTPGTMVLTQTRRDARGQTFTKETVVNEAKGLIVEHRLYAGAKAELLAQATITDHLPTTLSDEAGEGTDPDRPTVVYVPNRFRLVWVQEKFALDITLKPSQRSVFQINPTFDETQRTALFSEPKIDGTTRVDLARLDLPPGSSEPSPARGSQVRESRPMPGRGISLSAPIPDGSDSEPAEGLSAAATSPRGGASSTTERPLTDFSTTPTSAPPASTGAAPPSPRTRFGRRVFGG